MEPSAAELDPRVGALATMYEWFTAPFATRDWPTWARYGATALVVLAAAALKLWLWPHLQGYPFLFFFVAIMISAVLFDRGSGLLAVGLSAILAAYLFLEPRYNIRIARPQDVLAWIFYVGIGLTMATVIEAMHTAVHKLNDAIGDLHRANDRLLASDHEKDLLMREAAHRMRNDLQMLGALVSLQARVVQEPTARDALTSTSDRIRLLGQVQQRLRRLKGASVVDSHEFIVDLCGDLKDAILGLRPITLRVHAEPHDLYQNRAVAVGLIINECVTNSLKYAFPNERAGTVEVDFVKEDDRNYRLTVRDDGVGFGPERAPTTGAGGSGLGQRLVRSMAAQLGGTYEIGTDEGSPGTLVVVRFPIREE